MADDRDDVSRRGESQRYTLYRSKPRGLRERLRGEDAGLDELRPGGDGRQGPPRRRLRSGGDPRVPRPRRRITPRRVLLWLVLAAVGWLALSLVLFLLSAQIERGKVSAEAKAALTGAGYPLTSANTILILGSDARPAGSKEPGANPGGPSRSDTIMLWRVGGGHNARLSIPRDTVVDIPGHGQQKINAAYAFGGASLAIRTVSQYLGIPINHLMEVDFTHFPQLIDALGGVDVKTGRVCSEINGGRRNGGVTLRLPAGTNHLNGTQALALARTRKNDCNPAEDDLTRARRQQQLLSAMKSALISPGAFVRLPWISWDAPKAMRTDMGGPTLLGVFAASALGGSPPVHVLKPSGFVTLPDGGSALVVSDAEKQSAVRQFLGG
ncbi:MAG TPA: LCP family protein [Conexibacter sp.]|nr:LCP family protein [Conexibacter sp.]